MNYQIVIKRDFCNTFPPVYEMFSSIIGIKNYFVYIFKISYISRKIIFNNFFFQSQSGDGCEAFDNIAMKEKDAPNDEPLFIETDPRK